MQTISVRTTQNVFINYPLASLGDRILAFLLDRLFVILYAVAVFSLLYSLDAEAWWLWVILLLVPWTFCSLVFEIIMNGQSPGKRIMRIQVIRLDGAPATLGNFILRWLFALIEMGVIAVVIIAAGKKGQRLGDIVGGTTVVKLIEQNEITASDVFVTAEETYIPTFNQVGELLPKDIELIQRALDVNREQGNTQPIILVTEKIKTNLGIQTDLPPVKFLYTILKDYNHLSSKL